MSRSSSKSVCVRDKGFGSHPAENVRSASVILDVLTGSPVLYVDQMATAASTAYKAGSATGSSLIAGAGSCVGAEGKSCFLASGEAERPRYELMVSWALAVYCWV